MSREQSENVKEISPGSVKSKNAASCRKTASKYCTRNPFAIREAASPQRPKPKKYVINPNTDTLALKRRAVRITSRTSVGSAMALVTFPKAILIPGLVAAQQMQKKIPKVIIMISTGDANLNSATMGAGEILASLVKTFVVFVSGRAV
mmetsp:Transcript_31224/g.48283  ORF Transcript_31224/g.48283 Transcript_31224/m.48283 type:complete len:148 (+) Transcript_31224:374-817(+)